MKPSRRVPTGAVIALGALLLLPLVRITLLGNRHTVIAGEVHRSAQPSPDQLRGWIDELGLETVIHVRRGDADAGGQLDPEQRVARESGTKLEYVHLTARRLPSPAELQRLIDALDEAQRPLLVHCEAGIDRTGLASAVALLLDGADPASARRQFALRFGHPGPRLGSDLPIVVESYTSWLDAADLEHTPGLFRDWVREHYIPYFFEVELELLSHHQRPPGAHAPGAVELEVRVTNRSPIPIPIGCPSSGVRLSFQLYDLERERPSSLEPRSCVGSGDLAPGASRSLRFSGLEPQRPGVQRLRIDLVDERRQIYFRDMGSPILEQEIVIR